jgi:hypothetical protein
MLDDATSRFSEVFSLTSATGDQAAVFEWDAIQKFELMRSAED